MSKPRTAHQTIDLLEQMAGTLREVSARETALNLEFRRKTEAAERQFHAALEAGGKSLADEISQLDAAAQTERARLDHRYQERQARIRKALRPSNARALAKIEEHEGRQKHKIQKLLLDATRAREEGLAKAEAAREDYEKKLKENRAGFETLEQKAEPAFGGYSQFRQMLSQPGEVENPDPAQDEYQLLEELRRLQGQLTGTFTRFRRRPLPQLFRFLPLWLQVLMLAIVSFALVPALPYFGYQKFEYGYPHAAGLFVALVVFLLLLYFQGRRGATPLVKTISQGLEKAWRMHSAGLAKAQARHAQESGRIEAEYKSTTQALDQSWQTVLSEGAEQRARSPERIDQKYARVNEHLDRFHRASLDRVERERAEKVAQLNVRWESKKQQLAATFEERRQQVLAEQQAAWQSLEAEWHGNLRSAYAILQAENEADQAQWLPWQPSLWERWTPPAIPLKAVRFARLEVDLPKYAGVLPKDPRLALPGPASIAMPLSLVYPQLGSILFETSGSGGQAVAEAMNNILLRLLAASPPGKISLTIIDPVKLGQSFAGIMQLADFEENLINKRIWTQTTQIEQRLGKLTEHMEKVIQMYLRSEYETIAEYNAQAGNIAEKYHFVVIADFPAGFSEQAARRLLHIAASGARCGVFTLIHWDQRQPSSVDFIGDELRKNSVRLTGSETGFLPPNLSGLGARLTLDSPPPPDFAAWFLNRIGEFSRGSNRVEVPFAHVAPAETELWCLDTTSELRVPIGRSGATKLQYLTIGKGTRQHALVAGKTGSGKSTLFHVLITNLALWASPEQVEFYLVDFKKGVEFKCYAAHRLPHARVVAIESDREFGLSVLQRVDEELKRRGDLFRRFGVQDIAGFKRAGGTEPIPRSLLLIDEFQELFVEDDKVSQAAAVLLDRIVRQGRAFGIHVILGSQTLGGAYTLARTTMGQMVIRIALQCNEADAYLIMDENNPAPRLLSRPGEGIYNDAAGAMEGNSPFQTCWLSDTERDAVLAQVRRLADRKPGASSGPVVFEGNAPADVRDNQALHALLKAQAVRPAPFARAWLGAPNSIKGHTEALFQRRNGSHLLVVGQRDEAILALLSSALVSLAAQYPSGAARFILLDATPPGTPQSAFLEKIARAIGHPLTVAKSGDIPDLLGRLDEELNARSADEAAAAAAPETFLIIHDLHKFKKLRQEDDFNFSLDDSGKNGNAAAQFRNLISEGANLGFHLIVTLDSFNNVSRFLGRKGLSEFEMRVLFQMSANDSASLCDDPQASALGLHCALFYNEQEGYLEKFRPYALPANEWIQTAAANLARLRQETTSHHHGHPASPASQSPFS